MAAVLVQEALPLCLAILLLSDHIPRGSGVFSAGSRQVWVLCSIQQTSGAFVVTQGHLENAASSLGQSDSHLAGLFVSLGCADLLFLLYF